MPASVSSVSPDTKEEYVSPQPRRIEIRFWLCFLLLNGLFFLPSFLLNISEIHFSPLSFVTVDDIKQKLFAAALWREQGDPFRLNVEWLWLTAIWVHVTPLRRQRYHTIFPLLMLALYFLTLFYYTYESVMRFLYIDDPVFYSHYFLVRDGFRYMLENLNISPLLYLLVFVVAGAIFITIHYLLRTLLNTTQSGDLSRTSRITLLALTVASLLTVVSYRGATADPRMVVSSLAVKLEQNIAASIEVYRSVADFDNSTLRSAYDYRDQTLVEKPNIYLIFVESYGSVLYKRPDYKIAYLGLLAQMEETLQANDLHITSALSESPTWGGGSWLAYTSALYGLRMEEHPQYLAFLERYEEVGERTPNLGDYLRQEGYTFTWLTSIATELKEAKWQAYQRFYGVDRWIQYGDLAYKGVHYGWGPAPPDQFVLNSVRETLHTESMQPSLLFFITQNSHYPWQPLPELVADWRALDEPLPEGEPILIEAEDHADTRSHYLGAIDYSLQMLTDFMVNDQNENAIYIIVGDHQPPRVSRRDDGYETPIHVVSRDARFIESLAEYGFVAGADGSAETPQLRHEGLHSLLVRALVKNYGLSPELAPPYLQQGVIPPSWAVLPEAEPTDQPTN